MLSSIPLHWKAIALLVIATALYLAGMRQGYSLSERAHEVANARIERENIAETMRLVRVGVTESKQYQTAIAALSKFEVKHEVEIRERITPYAVDTCRLTRGTISVLNSATGVPADSATARGLDDAPAGIGIDTLARTVSRNYISTCRANAEQLRRLQSYVRAIGDKTREPDASRGQ